MRYDDWDVLLFPRGSIVPIKEFRTDCHLVHDIEFASTNGSTGLPTMTCFVPSLDAGSPFQISIHCWSEHPEVSQFTKVFSRHADLVLFEARVFIDGYFVA
ncbi:uncharacterized protein DNG_00128 [Cephalotrichum gorgonifer]|uniref:Uncharacterized protein n=1 Tax=Cephalotrichum gorgonifer TaxID=2041049 RepID=A0AAE8MPR6_9PEZI|nr:uncharacterized protein DNG_00128 [Cephalotrichum gorgonifer]